MHYEKLQTEKYGNYILFCEKVTSPVNKVQKVFVGAKRNSADLKYAYSAIGDTKEIALERVKNKIARGKAA